MPGSPFFDGGQGARSFPLLRLNSPPRCEASAGDFDRMERAPLAQRLLRGFRFEIVPALKGVSSRQQGAKFLVGASLAEDEPDLVEIIRQERAGKSSTSGLPRSSSRLSGIAT
jgi:hypothetical protein